MGFDTLHQLVVKWIDAPRHTERAIAKMAAGAVGDLADFARIEIAELITVELAVLRKGDMIDIKVEAHADGISRHEIFDVAGLVEPHLGVARTRRKRAHHNGCATTLAAHQLGNGIDLFRRKGDDCRALRQAGYLLLARIKKLRQARTFDHGNSRQQLFEDRAHRARTQKQRFLPPAQMQHAVGKDMPALQITGQLHFVDGDECGRCLARHGFHRTDGIFGFRRGDLFFAGYQRHIRRTHLFDKTGIDLTRQKAQRKADDTVAMCHHALDGVMGLAGIGGAENGRDTAAAQDHGARIQRTIRESTSSACCAARHSLIRAAHAPHMATPADKGNRPCPQSGKRSFPGGIFRFDSDS